MKFAFSTHAMYFSLIIELIGYVICHKAYQD